MSSDREFTHKMMESYRAEDSRWIKHWLDVTLSAEINTAKQGWKSIQTWSMQIKRRFIPARPFSFIATIYSTIKSLLQASNFPQRYFGSKLVRSTQSCYSEISTALDYEESERGNSLSALCCWESNEKHMAEIKDWFSEGWAAFPWTRRRRWGRALISCWRIERVRNLGARSCFLMESLT